VLKAVHSDEVELRITESFGDFLQRLGIERIALQGIEPVHRGDCHRHTGLDVGSRPPLCCREMKSTIGPGAGTQGAPRLKPHFGDDPCRASRRARQLHRAAGKQDAVAGDQD
jgi:hypothetical protein